MTDLQTVQKAEKRLLGGEISPIPDEYLGFNFVFPRDRVQGRQKIIDMVNFQINYFELIMSRLPVESDDIQYDQSSDFLKYEPNPIPCINYTENFDEVLKKDTRAIKFFMSGLGTSAVGWGSDDLKKKQDELATMSTETIVDRMIGQLKNPEEMKTRIDDYYNSNQGNKRFIFLCLPMGNQVPLNYDLLKISDIRNEYATKNSVLPAWGTKNFIPYAHQWNNVFPCLLYRNISNFPVERFGWREMPDGKRNYERDYVNEVFSKYFQYLSDPNMVYDEKVFESRDIEFGVSGKMKPPFCYDGSCPYWEAEGFDTYEEWIRFNEAKQTTTFTKSDLAYIANISISGEFVELNSKANIDYTQNPEFYPHYADIPRWVFSNSCLDELKYQQLTQYDNVFFNEKFYEFVLCTKILLRFHAFMDFYKNDGRNYIPGDFGHPGQKEINDFLDDVNHTARRDVKKDEGVPSDGFTLYRLVYGTDNRGNNFSGKGLSGGNRFNNRALGYAWAILRQEFRDVSDFSALKYPESINILRDAIKNGHVINGKKVDVKLYIEADLVSPPVINRLERYYLLPFPRVSADNYVTPPTDADYTDFILKIITIAATALNKLKTISPDDFTVNTKTKAEFSACLENFKNFQGIALTPEQKGQYVGLLEALMVKDWEKQATDEYNTKNDKLYTYITQERWDEKHPWFAYTLRDTFGKGVLIPMMDLLVTESGLTNTMVPLYLTFVMEINPAGGLAIGLMLVIAQTMWKYDAPQGSIYYNPDLQKDLTKAVIRASAIYIRDYMIGEAINFFTPVLLRLATKGYGWAAAKMSNALGMMIDDGEAVWQNIARNGKFMAMIESETSQTAEEVNLIAYIKKYKLGFGKLENQITSKNEQIESIIDTMTHESKVWQQLKDEYVVLNNAANLKAELAFANYEKNNVGSVIRRQNAQYKADYEQVLKDTESLVDDAWQLYDEGKTDIGAIDEKTNNLFTNYENVAEQVAAQRAAAFEIYMEGMRKEMSITGIEAETVRLWKEYEAAAAEADKIVSPKMPNWDDLMKTQNKLLEEVESMRSASASATKDLHAALDKVAKFKDEGKEMGKILANTLKELDLAEQEFNSLRKLYQDSQKEWFRAWTRTAEDGLTGDELTRRLKEADDLFKKVQEYRQKLNSAQQNFNSKAWSGMFLASTSIGLSIDMWDIKGTIFQLWNNKWNLLLKEVFNTFNIGIQLPANQANKFIDEIMKHTIGSVQAPANFNGQVTKIYTSYANIFSIVDVTICTVNVIVFMANYFAMDFAKREKIDVSELEYVPEVDINKKSPEMELELVKLKKDYFIPYLTAHNNVETMKSYQQDEWELTFPAKVKQLYDKYIEMCSQDPMSQYLPGQCNKKNTYQFNEFKKFTDDTIAEAEKIAKQLLLDYITHIGYLIQKYADPNLTTKELQDLVEEYRAKGIKLDMPDLADLEAEDIVKPPPE